MKKEYKLWRGRKVEIWSPDGRKFLGTGKYIGSEQHSFDFGEVGRQIWIPKFRLNEKIYYGWECWWIPTSVAKRLRAKLKKRKI